MKRRLALSLLTALAAAALTFSLAGCSCSGSGDASNDSSIEASASDTSASSGDAAAASSGGSSSDGEASSGEQTGDGSQEVSGSQGGTTEAYQASDFVGTWELFEVTGDSPVTHDEVEETVDVGLEVYITLQDDGNGEFCLYGSITPITWTFDSSGEANFVANDSDFPFSLEGSRLLLAMDDAAGTVMEFEKGQTRELSADSGQ